LHSDRYDTIELVSKTPHDLHNGDLLQKGFMLYFKPRKNKDFNVLISAGNNNSSTITIDPLAAASGEILTNQIDNKWSIADYNDSMIIGKKVYHQVLVLQGNCLYFSHFIYVKNIGLVSFWSQSLPGISGGHYNFIKTIKK
jgi:hypothetical protein